MDSFYLIVLGIATVFLVLMLAFITYAMMNSKNGMMTPVHDPTTGQYTNNLCPDYWEYDASNQVCKYPFTVGSGTSAFPSGKLNLGSVDGTNAADKKAVWSDSGTYKFTTTFKSPGSTSNGNESFDGTNNGIKPDAVNWQFYGNQQIGEVCAKYQWSKDTGIHWSGYSNSNQCV